MKPLSDFQPTLNHSTQFPLFDNLDHSRKSSMLAFLWVPNWVSSLHVFPRWFYSVTALAWRYWSEQSSGSVLLHFFSKFPNDYKSSTKHLILYALWTTSTQNIPNCSNYSLYLTGFLFSIKRAWCRMMYKREIDCKDIVELMELMEGWFKKGEEINIQKKSQYEQSRTRHCSHCSQHRHHWGPSEH